MDGEEGATTNDVRVTFVNKIRPRMDWPTTLAAVFVAVVAVMPLNISGKTATLRSSTDEPYLACVMSDL